MIMTAEEYIENNLIDSDYFKGYLYEEEIYDVIEMVRQEERNRAAILYGKLISKMYPEGIVNKLSENFRELLDKEFINLNKNS